MPAIARRRRSHRGEGVVGEKGGCLVGRKNPGVGVGGGGIGGGPTMMATMGEGAMDAGC